MSEVKCIIFDWGGVLIENPVEDFIRECSKNIGVTIDQLKNVYSEYSNQFEKGEIVESELWKKVGKKLNIEINNNSIWKKSFTTVYSPRNNMFKLAERLKQNGYFIALLSNTEVPAMNFFFEQNYNMFDYKIFSCKEGFVKPDPKLYKILLEQINISASQSIFIDDKQENILAAQKLGMKAIVYKSYENLLENLRKYQIVI